MAAQRHLEVLDTTLSLRRLEPADRARLGAAMTPREHPAGHVLLRIGDESPDAGLYLVVSGEVSVAHNARTGAVPLSRTVGAGALFGESTVLQREGCNLGARCLTPARLLFLPRARFDALADEVPALRALVADMAALRALEPEVHAGLRRSALSRQFSPRMLSEMSEVAEVISLEPDAVVVRQDDPSPGFFYVVSGVMRATVRGSDGRASLVDTLHPGDVFGDIALVTGAPQPSTVSAWGRARVARVEVSSFRSMITHSQGERRAARGEAPGMEGLAASPAEATRRGATRLFVPRPEWPVAAVASLVAEHLAAAHEDNVLVVRFAPEGDAATTRVTGRVARAVLPTDDARAAERLDALLDRVGGRFDYVLLDATGRSEAFLAAVAGRAERLVNLTRDTHAPLPSPALADLPTQHALLLGATRHHDGVSIMPTMHSGTVRMRLDLDLLARRGAARLDDLLPDERESVARLARAVSNRRVGVALGGGGAWGYAHVTLLRAMREAAVPVDLVAGCSFGAVVGAYWCARGERGAELLFERAAALRNAVGMALVSSTSIARLVDADLGAVLLEDLDVPFFPVATDVASGTQRPIKSGSIGRGVRASGAFPLTFSPVTSRGHRLVDGGIINNVPEDVLVQEGADLVVASNVVSQPPPVPVSQPLFPGAAGRFLHELEPVGRVVDVVRSLLILMHSAGSRDAHLADVTYNADPVPAMPWDFSAGRFIADHARPSVARTMPELREQWTRLAAPASSRDPIDALEQA